MSRPQETPKTVRIDMKKFPTEINEKIIDDQSAIEKSGQKRPSKEEIIVQILKTHYQL